MGKKVSIFGKLALLSMLGVSSFILDGSQARAASSIAPSVAVGASHSLALKDDGTVWAWGNNDFGQLGNGTTKDSPVPIQVPNLDSVVKITAGYGSSYAVKSDGTVWSWGMNNYGQLGDGTLVKKITPVPIPNLTGVIDITVSHSSVFAVKNDGTVYAWGQNSNAALGIGIDGPNDKRPMPVKIKELSNIKDVETGGYSTLALSNDGTVWAWGSNQSGQVGDGTIEKRLSPVKVQNLDSVKAISVGQGSMAVKEDGSLWSWGRCDLSGFYATCKAVNMRVPVKVPDVDEIKDIATPGSNAIALRKDGTLRSWGYNHSGQLGIGILGTSINFYSPQTPIFPTMETFDKVMSIEANDHHVLAIRNDGTVWAWGNNSSGQIGEGTIGGKKPYPTSTGLQLISNDQLQLGQTVQLDIPNGTTKSYTFVSPKDGTVTISTGFLDMKADTILNVYDSSGTLLETNDDYNNSTYSSVLLNVTANTRYTIEVSGFQKAGVRCILKIE
ncbi:RCC1 repeat- and reductase domain-containing protein [Paenibacillus chitinolyticus]|uniref:RCC1 domain-containing protein n=1 Tax=Paenibacillus chitinolyticus TaxID=79263 RepID=UPI002DB5BCEB|nr:RCC1 repeat- and reductase domain-containing protein [Paenibacillus chitinolyticus]MEC0248474.1 RCC1 repeat- and reductase domain-containing protein [Paenibacillus chitinolyticus]